MLSLPKFPAATLSALELNLISCFNQVRRCARHQKEIAKTMTARSSEPIGPESPELVIASSVMGNRTKSLIVRHLWQNGPSPGTRITKETGISGPTMSLAMQQLEQWGVVSASIPPEQRHGRSVVYTLDRDRIRGLVKLWMNFVEGGIT